jgi:hypothetical protein
MQQIQFGARRIRTSKFKNLWLYRAVKEATNWRLEILKNFHWNIGLPAQDQAIRRHKRDYQGFIKGRICIYV